MKREAMKEKVKRLINMGRAVCAYNVCISAMASAVFAGILMAVTVGIGVVEYLRGVGAFGTRQWSIMVSLLAIGAFSVVIAYVLGQRCGLSEDAHESEDEVEDEASRPPAMATFVVAMSILPMFCVWFFVMGWFIYMAGELDVAGFGVAEVAMIEVLALSVIGVALNKFCKIEL